MLEVFRLRKEFPRVVAVDDLSFEIPHGKVCGFVGPNGSGKTTTMRMIATLEMPTRGEIRINGASIFDAPYASRRAIGFMPDHLGVYPDMTVSDYLNFYARAYEIPAKERRRRVADVMDFTELVKIREKLVETLSKGMRQRLNLGRALLNDPKLLIMDEPAAGLDPRARVELRILIKQLAEIGKSVFISSHILTELGEMCDSMLIIERGRTVANDTLSGIKSKLERAHLSIGIRLLPTGDLAKLQERLSELPTVAGLKLTPHGVLVVEFRADETASAGLLKSLIGDGFPVCEFSPHSESMEELFMMLTTGEVQ